MLKRLLIGCSVAALAVAAFAQIGTLIFLEGSMTVDEGGRAKGLARVTQTQNGIGGRFELLFSTGELAQVRIDRFNFYSVPGSTAFFGGQGTALIRQNGNLVPVQGDVFVMVDDLDHDNLPFPDQLFLRFDGGGRTIIRHAKMTGGDIVVRF